MAERPALPPHRPLFLIAALLWLLSSAVWALQLTHPRPTAWPAPAWHGLLMSLAFMPAFMAGFAFTALPRWLALPALDARTLAAPSAALLGGWLLALPGLLMPSVPPLAPPLAAPLAAGGLALAALGLGELALRLLQLCRQPQAARSGHAWGLSAGLLLCAAALALAALGALRGQALLLRGAAQAGLWFGVASVYALALHRLSPFLHAQGRRAAAPMALLLAGLWLRGGLALCQLYGIAQPAWLQLSSALFCLGLAGLLLRAGQRPELAAARRTPLVAQLHLGFLWLVLSFALAAAALLAAALGADSASALDRAALHALSLGFMGSTLLAMASRVTAVQHGRSIAVDGLLWALQALLQALTVARLLAACVPALLVPASLGFALLALAWGLRYGPWLLRGRPARTRS